MSEKPNVLMITPYLPYPPSSGGRSRTYNLLKRLVRDFQFTIVCFARPEEKPSDLTPLTELADLIMVNRDSSPGTLQAAMLSLTSLKPITMRLYHSTEFRDALRQVMRKRLFDVVHVESFYMMPNLPEPLNLPVLLSEPAIEFVAWQRHARVAHPIYQRPAIALEALKMRYFEPQTWRRATMIGTMSEIDSTVVKRFNPHLPIRVTPNGVDVDYFKPSTLPRDSDTAIFMGDYKYFPNTDAVSFFVKEIMPLVRAQRPNFKLILLGKEPPAEIVALAAQPNSGIQIEGFVEDTRPYLHQASLFVCPLRSGSGTRFKLLEALACGLPVVSTRIGAEGLDAVADRHMVFADSPEAFAASMLHLLRQPEEAQRIGRYGRTWVTDRHSWARSAGLLGDAYQTLIGSEDMTIPSPMSRRARRRGSLT